MSSGEARPDAGSVHHTWPVDPTVEPKLQFFEYAHLRDDLQVVSAPFCALAVAMVNLLPRNPERSVALRKLLEAKDAAVRAVLYK